MGITKLWHFTLVGNKKLSKIFLNYEKQYSKCKPVSRQK